MISEPLLASSISLLSRASASADGAVAALVVATGAGGSGSGCCAHAEAARRAAPNVQTPSQRHRDADAATADGWSERKRCMIPSRLGVMGSNDAKTVWTATCDYSHDSFRGEPQ